ncbi:MAG: hypothetical protein JXM73_09605, partial [Anaerolineae bacterium]|nr:hypothetical protein [Anaerolineae bacterium]
VANVYLIRPASSIRKFNAGYEPLGEQRSQGDQMSDVRVQKMHSQAQTVGVQKVHSQSAMGVQKMHTQTCGSAKSALNKKEDKEGEEEKISSILARFVARKGDPASNGGPQERRKVQGLLDEGYSAEQIAAAIDQAFDARPAKAKPVRGFGFVVSHIHRHLSPASSAGQQPPSTEDSTEVLTEGLPPTGEPTGMTTETKVIEGVGVMPSAEATGDPLARVRSLLRAASIQGMEGVDDTFYDLPGIRLGICDLLEREAPFSPDEVYGAVLAAVVRNVPPERLVAYAGAVLENARAEDRERERLHQIIAETVHTGQGDREQQVKALEPSVTAAQGAEHPPPDSCALALWQSALGELEMQMTRATFSTWLRPTRLLAWEPAHGDGSGNSSTHVILGVPNGYVRDWLENRLLTPIRRTLCGVAGQPVEIAFQVEGFPEQMQ